MSAPVVIMDTETTGLSLDDDVWEFAGIRRDDTGGEQTLHLFIEHDPVKCRRLPESFREDHRARFPAVTSSGKSETGAGVISRVGAAALIGEFTAGAHIVGAVPNFDTERLALLLRGNGVEPGWHYHLIDVETLAVGYLRGWAEEMPGSRAADFLAKGLPWDSEDLSRAVGVDPDQFERHTAMGDVRWAMAIYDAVMGGVS